MEIRFFSAGGSRANAFLRCAVAGAPASVKAVADARGFVDGERLIATQPELADACSNGITWLIIEDNANVTGIKSFAQRGLNADAREAAHETEIIRIGYSRSA